ncbi:MAG: hypothetical protein IPH35_16300 [Rhodoferax sp.]|nr:hypothetical protein [Rhodoferax sp.]
MPRPQTIPLPLPLLLPLILALGGGSGALLADSLVSSSASITSQSLGSSSVSLQKSSDSSSSRNQVAQGQYTIIDMAEVPQQPDMLRVQLQGQASTQEFSLLLPRATAQRVPLQVGAIVEVQHRPYGLAFATAAGVAAKEPFFLVLDDAWYRELNSQRVRS